MDTLIANIARKLGIRTGVVSAAYNLDTNRPTVLLAPTAESLVYTVAAVGTAPGTENFDTFDEALEFTSNLTFIKNGKVTLRLKDGEHYLRESNALYFRKCYLTIQSDSNDAALCTLTYPPDVTAGLKYVAYMRESTLSFYKVTIDPKLNTIENVRVYAFFNAYSRSQIAYTYCVIKGLEKLVCYNGSVLSFSGTTCSDAYTKAVALSSGAVFDLSNDSVIDNCPIGILFEGDRCQVSSGYKTATISNCNYGIKFIDVNYGTSNSTATFPTGSLILSGNAADSDIPLNTITRENNLFSTGDAAITLAP